MGSALYMTSSADVLWIGDDPGSPTPHGAVARGIIPHLEQTYGLRAAVVGWSSTDEAGRPHAVRGAVVGRGEAPWDANVIRWAMAEFSPRAVVTCCAPERISALARLLGNAPQPWLAHVDVAQHPPDDDALDGLRRATAVATFSASVASGLAAALPAVRTLGLGVDADSFRPLVARRSQRLARGLGDGAVVGCWGGALSRAAGLRLLTDFSCLRSSFPSTTLLLALEPHARSWHYRDWRTRLGLEGAFQEIGDAWTAAHQEGDQAFNELLNLLDVLLVASQGPVTPLLALEAASAGVVVAAPSMWVEGPLGDDFPHRPLPARSEGVEPTGFGPVLQDCLSDGPRLEALRRLSREMAVLRSWSRLAESWNGWLTETANQTEAAAGTTPRPRAATGVKAPSAGSSRQPAPAVSEAAARLAPFLPEISEEDRRRSVAILAPSFFHPTPPTGGDTPIMGGGERYLVDLAQLLEDRGLIVHAFQPSAQPWRREYGRLVVFGLGATAMHYDTYPSANLLFHEVTAGYGHVIYHAFNMCYPACRPGSIAISHGVWWDTESDGWWRSPEWRRRLLSCLENAAYVVSVDTNTLNWVRAERPDLGSKLSYVPNAVDLGAYRPSRRRPGGQPLTVLFPRRLAPGRGFAVACEIAEDLCTRRSDIRFRFVGRGDEAAEQRIAELAARVPGIEWEWRHLEEMPSAYREADITIIPSLFSEGTSLSCLEAMASGNAVLATNVGGLGNLVLNDYNGLLVEPTTSAIREGLVRLLDGPDLRKQLSQRARQTAQVFDKDRWRERWAGILDRHGLTAPERGEAVRLPQATRLPAPVIAVLSLGYWGMTGGGQRPQKLAEAFARRGFSVVHAQDYLGPPVPLPPGVALLPVADIVPGGYLAAARTLDAKVLRRFWRRFDELCEARPALAIFAACTPMMVALAREFRKKRIPVVYDVLDDWEAFQRLDDCRWYRKTAERDMLRVADNVTAVSPALVRKLGPDVTLSPNAAEWTVASASPSKERPKDLPPGTEPTVGYVGSLSGKWHDWDVARHVAEARPTWQVVLIGPGGDTLPRALTDLPNVSVLPAKPSHELGPYLDHFDVGIVPFKQNALCDAVSPIKAYDYLARGCPVVSSPMSGLNGLPNVRVAGSPDEWVAAVEAAAGSRRDRPLKWLHANTWDARLPDVLAGPLRCPTDQSLRSAVGRRRRGAFLLPDVAALRVHWRM
ncbi:MAG: glycosyltransferase, partial [Armatimonadetes bacterium]|nr:glycosyltransferase [Armatimonadota bacterium]